MPAPFSIVGIDHVVLRAADPAALERFYLDVLGLNFEKRQGGLAQLSAGDALIDIVPADHAGSGPQASGIPERRVDATRFQCTQSRLCPRGCVTRCHVAIDCGHCRKSTFVEINIMTAPEAFFRIFE